MKKLNNLQLALVATTTALLLSACGKNAAVDSAITLSNNDGQIVGGTVVESDDEVGHSTVGLASVNVGIFCTASLIDKDLIVTAAHCADVIKELDDSDRLIVVFNHDLTVRKLTVRPVVGLVYHPAWETRQNETQDTGDIAVMRFRGSLPEGFKEANLLEDAALLEKGADITLAGFGVLSMRPKINANELMKVSVLLTDVVGKTELKFEQHKGGGACHGDSGGPAFATVDGKLTLVGVTSRSATNAGGLNCMEGSIYTSIAANTAFLKKAAQVLHAPEKSKDDKKENPSEETVAANP